MGRGRQNGIPLTPRSRAVLDKQLVKFREKFGREPGPHDPVFFDPDCDQPTPISLEKLAAQCRKAAKVAGVDVSQFADGELLDMTIGAVRRHRDLLGS